jgi:hypothetical protein
MLSLAEVKRQAGRMARSYEKNRFVSRQLARGLSDLTMVEPNGLVALVGAVDEVVARGVPGCFVECGVWRGGASILGALRFEARGRRLPVWMFDSFEGLPPPRDEDGPAAIAWARDTEGPSYHDNCTASEREARDAVARFGVEAHIVKGWFDQTLPAERERMGPIALLRIDGDWYDSVLCCLTNLYDQVSPGGWIVFDDYYDWDGCALAVYDFLATRRLPVRLVTSGPTVYFVKPRLDQP